jgi:hypothetical protein
VKEFLQKSLKDYTFSGNGRFAINLADEMIQVQAMRLMNDDSEEALLEKVRYLEKEDVEKALKKQRNGES